MNKYKNILVVADPIDSPQIALSRALYLGAQQDDVKITLLLVIYDLSYELTSLFSSGERQTMQDAIVTEQHKTFINKLATDYPNTNIDLQVIWHKRPFESILVQAEQGQHDLIVKSTHQHNKLSAVVFTPTDWHLLRKSECPVLLVKDQQWPVNGNLVAAVQVLDTSSVSADITEINERIINESLSLQKLLSAHLHLVNAYPRTPEHVSIEIPNFDAVAYNKQIEDHHIESMAVYGQQYNISADKIHVAVGAPEEVIAQVVADVNAELLVLGAPTRDGISAFLIGNTAEIVVDSIHCDLLALR